MKILGKKGKNLIIEVTPHEMSTIQTALFEWQGIEDDTIQPVRSFIHVFDRIARAQGRFDRLPVIKQKKIDGKQTLQIENNKEKK